MKKLLIPLVLAAGAAYLLLRPKPELKVVPEAAAPVGKKAKKKSALQEKAEAKLKKAAAGKKKKK